MKSNLVFILCLISFQPSLTRRYAIIDTDAGTDDMEAVLFLLAKKDIEIVAITLVAGNVEIHQGRSNMLRVLTYIDRTRVPVHKGRDLTYNGQRSTSDSFYGENGIGNVKLPLERFNTICAINATQALINLSKKHPGELEIFAIGPLTNLAFAMDMDPDFAGRLKAVYVLGGDRQATTVGNVTPYAEFNIWYDPLGAKKVLQEMPGSVKMIIADWKIVAEFAPHHSMVKNALNGKAMRETERIQKLLTLLENEESEGNKQRIDNGKYIMPDLMTTLTGYAPQVTTTSTISLCDLTLTGEQKGHTVFCNSTEIPSLQLIESIDIAEFEKIFVEAFVEQ